MIIRTTNTLYTKVIETQFPVIYKAKCESEHENADRELVDRKVTDTGCSRRIAADLGGGSQMALRKPNQAIRARTEYGKSRSPQASFRIKTKLGS
ncbi:hypothetical protein EVAR_71232_1 [Eumeta japonica]|uniref:Uncharacterized protein n=1 Tax=Eumeta variegata TaxID=151549 RepID=A0A4C1TMZ2_EUMVA|nr:hypothetical protein EVAR_71232_1 [Eumeta japonica]